MIFFRLLWIFHSDKTIFLTTEDTKNAEGYKEKSIICHPEGIYAVVVGDIACKCKVPYRMTSLVFVDNI